MINATIKALFAIFCIALAIFAGSVIAQLFALISVGGASNAFAIAGSALALIPATDFVKNEVYGKY